MLEILLILGMVIWTFYALRSVRHRKGGCSGNCLTCHQKSESLCEKYRRDHPKESR